MVFCFLGELCGFFKGISGVLKPDCRLLASVCPSIIRACQCITRGLQPSITSTHINLSFHTTFDTLLKSAKAKVSLPVLT